MPNRTKHAWDTIVVGLGGVGSAALGHLAARGQRVLGIEQFAVGHKHGSSHGHTRVIRQAYFEHADYVPLLLRSYELWEQLERETNTRLMRRIGLVEIGPRDGEVVRGVLHAAEAHQLAIERLSPTEVRSRYPALGIRDDWQAVFEAAAGYLRVDDAVQAHQQWALDQGASIRETETVRSWSTTPQQATVTTDGSTFTAAALVITAGAWTRSLLTDLGHPLRVLRKDLYWFAAQPACRESAGLPVFLYELDDGIFYGFPNIDQAGVKVGQHTGGREYGAPSARAEEVIVADLARVEQFVSELLPATTTQRLRHDICWYTMSPDGHFLVGPHPHQPNVYVAAGLSGHGFKFTPVLGELLADLVCEGVTQHPADFLRLNRHCA